MMIGLKATLVMLQSFINYLFLLGGLPLVKCLVVLNFTWKYYNFNQ